MKKSLIVFLSILSFACAKEDAETKFKSISTQNLVAATLILEAGGEKDKDAMRAVHEVIVNRSKQKNRLQRQVILRRKQFSCWNGSYEDKLRRYRKASKHKKFKTAVSIAQNKDYNHQVTNGATHYHATYVSPYWKDSMNETVTIENHIFYKED
jgi:spore germination cell wall hydrolase CwlJ-like protein